jgi:hypothetical protein
MTSSSDESKQYIEGGVVHCVHAMRHIRITIHLTYRLATCFSRASDVTCSLIKKEIWDLGSLSRSTSSMAHKDPVRRHQLVPKNMITYAAGSWDTNTCTRLITVTCRRIRETSPRFCIIVSCYEVFRTREYAPPLINKYSSSPMSSHLTSPLSYQRGFTLCETRTGECCDHV